ncbi:MAG: VWA domain-containing protein [Myxococcales bacterium]|nr:VWA domain-containing protein [Myxococcales bacterium]
MKKQWLAVLALLVCTLAWGAARGHRGTPGGEVTGGGTTVSAGVAGVEFHAQLDRNAVLAGSDGRVVLELGIVAPASSGANSLPTDVVVVLDRSGSMNGEKLEHARAAIHSLVAGLRSEDRFALVSYAHHARIDFPLQYATPERKAGWSSTATSIAAHGGTNLAAGLDQALALVDGALQQGRAARVLLLSDGLANEGDTSRDGLRNRASRAARGEYILSTIGVGLEFDEELLALLADAGTGNYHYLESARGLDHIFAVEFASARETVAEALRVVLDLPDGADVLDAAGYPLERSGSEVSFRPGALFSGQNRRIGVSLRVPTSVGERHVLRDVRLEFRAAGERHAIALEEPLTIAVAEQEEEYLASVDRQGWARSVVIDEYNALRKRVSRAVARGNKEEAKREISRFATEVEAANQVLAVPEVGEQLQELRALEAEVDDSFVGADAAKKQRSLGKSLHHEAISDGRVGSRK